MKDKILDTGKWAVDKMKSSGKGVEGKGAEEKGKPGAPEKGEGNPTEEKAASNARKGSSEEQLTNNPIVGKQTAKLTQDRELANQEQSAKIGK